MISIFEIVYETLSFSILVSFLTFGISAASNEGAVLYPIKLWMYRLSKREDVTRRIRSIQQYQNKRRAKRMDSYWIDSAIICAKLKLLRREWWMKMVLICTQCMPTLYSAIIYWTVFYDYPIYIWLLGWPVSSALNYFINKRL